MILREDVLADSTSGFANSAPMSFFRHCPPRQDRTDRDKRTFDAGARRPATACGPQWMYSFMILDEGPPALSFPLDTFAYESGRAGSAPTRPVGD